MMNWTLLKAKLAPYMLAIKLAWYALILGIGIVLGFKFDPDQDCGQLNAETAAEIATLRKANADYAKADEIRAQAAQTAEQQNAAQNKALATAAATARKEASTLKDKLAEVERKQAAARGIPECRELMELEVCDAL